MCAQFTQKDPKEYLPYLQKLKDVENEIERKKLINFDLKNYTQAAIELAKGNDSQVEQCFEIIRDHKLFEIGLKLFKNNKPVLKQVQLLLAENLLAKQEY